MRYTKLRRILFALTMITALCIPQAGNAQTENAIEGRQPIGLTLITKGAIQPIVDHTPPGKNRRNVPTAFAIEVDALYRLPIEVINLDVGIGGRYLFERSTDNGTTGYSLLPLYVAIQLPFALPSLEKFWEIYLDGKIGYVFFLPTERYKTQYLASTNNLTGGLFIGFGLGTLYNIYDWLQLRLLVSYNIHSIDAMSRGAISDSIFEVSVGVGFGL